MLSRRQFAKLLGSGACLLPFLPAGRALAATAPKRRLVIVWSLATNQTWWRPTSAAGQPVAFADSIAPLKDIAADVVLLDGLTPAATGETHGTPQALTGVGFSGPGWLSVDQFIAKSLGLPPPLLLGVQASSAVQFLNAPKQGNANYGGMPIYDDPAAAFTSVFGGQATQTPMMGSGGAMPRKGILDLASAQIKSLEGSLGSQEKAKLEAHLAAIASIDGSAAATKPAAGCQVPAAPDLKGADALSQMATVPVGEAHQDIIVAALACGLTQMVGMQWGTSSTEYLSGTVNHDEHSGIHSSVDIGKPIVLAAEQYLAGWFVNLVNKLRKTADPFEGGKTLLDTTLVLWTRDFGHQDTSNHINMSMPFVLAGATDYLKTSPTGVYQTYGGDNLQNRAGEPHQRLLLNLCEAMGVSDSSGFGSLSADKRQPLADIRK